MKLQYVYLLIAGMTLVINIAVVYKLMVHLHENKAAHVERTETVKVFRISRKKSGEQAATLTLTQKDSVSL